MVFTLLGYSDVSFTDKSSGQLIEGSRFYFAGDDGSRSLVGQSCFDFFMTSRRLEQIGFLPSASDVGSEYEIFYNRFGKVCDIRSVYDKR